MDVPRQFRRLLGVADVQARRDDEPIAAEVLEVRQHVDAESEPAQRLVVAQHSRLVAEDVVGGLNLKRKPRVVVVDERDVRLRSRRSEHRAQELQLGAQRLEICVAAARGTVGLEDAVPVLLRPEAGRPPAKEKHGFRSMRDRLVRPQPDLAWGGREHRPPPHRPGLLLHDPRLPPLQPSHGFRAQRRR